LYIFQGVFYWLLYAIEIKSNSQFHYVPFPLIFSFGCNSNIFTANYDNFHSFKNISEWKFALQLKEIRLYQIK